MKDEITENQANPDPFTLLDIDTTTEVAGVRLKITTDANGRHTLSLQAASGSGTASGTGA